MAEALRSTVCALVRALKVHKMKTGKNSASFTAAISFEASVMRSFSCSTLDEDVEDLDLGRESVSGYAMGRMEGRRDKPYVEPHSRSRCRFGAPKDQLKFQFNKYK
jgi:hypothetical protein